MAACAAVFAFGETLLQPTIPALVNDLAPDHLRGRYNALSSGAFQLAAVIAPPIAGFLIGRALGDVYIGLLVVGCLVSGSSPSRGWSPSSTRGSTAYARPRPPPTASSRRRWCHRSTSRDASGPVGVPG